MQHPFDGVILAGTSSPDAAHATATPAASSRRSFLGRSAAALGAILMFGRGSAAEAQQGKVGRAGAASTGTRRRSRYTTYALGEEGGGPWPPGHGHHDHGHGPVTTYALGEEGGRVTTFALGEEGGGWHDFPPPRHNRGPVTTYALGEEGGRYTTFALGEEGGWY